MAEGEHDKGKDELFEDLDKFFAPIQDVEWPESESPTESTPEPNQEREQMSADVGSEATGTVETPETTIEIPEASEPAIEVGDQGSAGAVEGGEFEGVVVRQTGETSDARNGLFEEEAEPPVDEDWPVDASEADAEQPAKGSDFGDEPIAEGSVPDSMSEPPTIDVVEEAAEHFAPSVRAGTGFGDEHIAADDSPAQPVEPPGGVVGDDTVETVETITEPMETADLAHDADLPPGGEGSVEESLLADLDEPDVSQRTVVVGSGEGLGGPSWQEPTSVEIGSEAEPRSGERDLPAAFLTGLGLAVVALASLLAGRAVFAAVAGLIALWAMGELYGVMAKRHLQPATAVGLVSGALVLGGAYFHGEPAMAAMLALGTVASFLWFMTVPSAHRKNISVAIGVTLLPMVYVAVLAGYALVIVGLPDPLNGVRLIIAVIVLTFTYDAAAFAIGSLWGTRPLAQTISPKKSWEGALGATLVVIPVAIVLATLIGDPLASISKPLGLAIVVSIFAPLGDLAESLIKRDLDVKDMGSILPGHGGVLDRIDSLLFVAPAAFLYFRIFL